MMLFVFGFLTGLLVAFVAGWYLADSWGLIAMVRRGNCASCGEVHPANTVCPSTRPGVL